MARLRSQALNIARENGVDTSPKPYGTPRLIPPSPSHTVDRKER